MLNTVKNVMHTIGEGTGGLARRVGGTTTDVAKRFGHGTAGVARRVGDGSIDLARKIGPKRGLIGLAVIGAATVGTIYLVRYLRARREELAMETESGDEAVSGGRAPTPSAKRKRAARGSNHPMH
jgi:hypothetical protein